MMAPPIPVHLSPVDVVRWNSTNDWLSEVLDRNSIFNQTQPTASYPRISRGNTPRKLDMTSPYINAAIDCWLRFLKLSKDTFLMDPLAGPSQCSEMGPVSGELKRATLYPTLNPGEESPIIAYSLRNNTGPVEYLLAEILPEHVGMGRGGKNIPESVKKTARTWGMLPGDQCGHVIGCLLGGGGQLYNAFLQTARINQKGLWPKNEHLIAALLKDTRLGITKIMVQVQFHFNKTEPLNQRATHFCFRTTVYSAVCELFTYGYSVTNASAQQLQESSALHDWRYTAGSAALHVAANPVVQKTALEVLGNSGVKVGAKMTSGLSKYIPLVGIAVGFGQAAHRIYTKRTWSNVLKGAGEITSGVFATLPGYGTAAALAIDGVVIASDLVEFHAG